MSQSGFKSLRWFPMMRAADRFAAGEIAQPAAPTSVPDVFKPVARHRFVSRHVEEYVSRDGSVYARLHYVECGCGQRFVHRYDGPENGPFAAGEEEWEDARAHTGQGRIGLSRLADGPLIQHVVPVTAP